MMAAPYDRARLTDALAVYLVTDRPLMQGRNLLDVVLAAVAGGVGMVQLREKTCDTGEFVALARALLARLAPLGVPLLINDRVDVALASGAQGVHLGQRDMPVADARALLPAGSIIGWSVETPVDLARAAALPLDYLAISPVFATRTKADTAPPWGLSGLSRARAATALPLVAIGGVDAGNARALHDAGADGLAVVSALCAADDPCRAARRLRQAFGA